MLSKSSKQTYPKKKKKKIKKGNYDTRKKKKPYPHAQNVCDEASINGIN